MIVEFWNYVNNRIKFSIMFDLSKQRTSITNAIERRNVNVIFIDEKIDRYNKILVEYDIKKNVYDEKHEKTLVYLNLIVEKNSRIHIAKYINAKETRNMLKKQYEISNLITLNMSLQEICRTNQIDKVNLEDYVQHLKQYCNKIKIVEKNVSKWMLKSFFWMSLFIRFNFYVFQLIHFVKTNNKKFIIDDMIIVLINQNQRETYVNNVETIKTMKFKFTSNEITSNEIKKNRKQKFCNNCDLTKHNELFCFYINKYLRFKNWKSYEIKRHLIVDYEKDFISIKDKKKQNINDNFLDNNI